MVSASPSFTSSDSSKLTSKTKRETAFYSDGQSPIVHQELSPYYDEAGNQLYYKDPYQQDPNIFYEKPSYSPDAATAYAGHGEYEGYGNYESIDPYYEKDPYYQYQEEGGTEGGIPLVENVIDLISKLTPTFGLERQDDGDDEEDDDYDDDYYDKHR